MFEFINNFLYIDAIELDNSEVQENGEKLVIHGHWLSTLPFWWFQKHLLNAVIISQQSPLGNLTVSLVKKKKLFQKEVLRQSSGNVRRVRKRKQVRCMPKIFKHNLHSYNVRYQFVNNYNLKNFLASIASFIGFQCKYEHHSLYKWSLEFKPVDHIQWFFGVV